MTQTKPKVCVPTAVEDAMFIDENSAKEEVLEAIRVAELFAEQVKSLRQHFDDGLMRWLLKHGELEQGETRWYVGHSKRTRCLDPVKTLDTIAELCKGNLERVCEYFSSSPFKYGSVKDLMDNEELYRKHFESIPITDVRTGKPRKRIKKTDTRYAKEKK